MFSMQGKLKSRPETAVLERAQGWKSLGPISDTSGTSFPPIPLLTEPSQPAPRCVCLPRCLAVGWPGESNAVVFWKNPPPLEFSTRRFASLMLPHLQLQPYPSPSSAFKLAVYQDSSRAASPSPVASSTPKQSRRQLLPAGYGTLGARSSAPGSIRTLRRSMYQLGHSARTMVEKEGTRMAPFPS